MLDLKTRVAIWRANDCRCFYCLEPVSFRDLEIDHIVPARTTTIELERLCHRINLAPGFGIDALSNLVPTHHDCNNRKGGAPLEDGAIAFYLQLWAKKQERIGSALETQRRAAARDKHLIAISAMIESGEISKQELWRVVSNIRPLVKPKPEDPWVITFGTNVSDLVKAGTLPDNAGETYAAICDWLENDLLFKVSASPPILAQRTEGSARNGETLSLRIAFWHLDLDNLEDWELGNWSILEIASFSELYETSPSELMTEAIVRASNQIISDPWDTVFGIGRCPRCGSDRLKRYSTIDHTHDDVYHTVECSKCGWLEWTQ